MFSLVSKRAVVQTSRAMSAAASASPPVHPRDVDERARAEGVGIGDIRDLIPKECHTIVPWRSWSALFSAFVRLAFTEALLLAVEPTWGVSLVWQIPALVAAWILTGWALTGIFVLGHDAAHMAFSDRKWVNELVGHLTLSVAFTAFHNWRIGHNYHHAKTQLRGQDPDWAEKMMTRAEYDRANLGDKAHVKLGFGTPIGLITGFWVGILRRTFMRALIPQISLSRGAVGEMAFSSIFTVATVGAISFALYRFGGAWAVVKLYYVPAVIAATHGAMLTYLHHTSADGLVFDKVGWTPFRGQVVSTFNVRFPAICEAMWFDINIHLPHHLAPKIPWYHLKPAAEAIRAARPEMFLERRFSLAYMLAAWQKPLLTPVPGEDYFAMTSFAESEGAGASEAPAPAE